jgi:hypothetical protein
LTLYGSDIFVLDNDQTSSLWGKRSGFDPAGLDYLIERSKGYYVRRQRDRTLKRGDRVAILGPLGSRWSSRLAVENVRMGRRPDGI